MTYSEKIEASRNSGDFGNYHSRKFCRFIKIRLGLSSYIMPKFGLKIILTKVEKFSECFDPGQAKQILTNEETDPNMVDYLAVLLS